MAVVVAVLVGLLLGGSMGRDVGLLAGPAIGFLLVVVLRLQREVKQLAATASVERARLEALAAALAASRGAVATVAATETTAAAAPTVDATAPPAASAAVPPVAAEPVQPGPLPVRFEPVPVTVPLGSGDSAAVAAALAAATLKPAASATSAPLPEAGSPPVAPARPAGTARAPRAFLGGNAIVKLGVAILFVGLAFLAKYAAENTQVPIEWRLTGIGVVALVLLVLGWRLRERRRGYAQVLQGGAIAVVYLTLFSAFRFYGVLEAAPAFLCMAAVVVLAAALAVLQDARSLAVIGALGGFLAPLLLSTGGGNVVALFAWYLALDVGIALIAWARTWRVLDTIAFVFTWVVATAWGVLRYDPAQYAVGQGFLLAFFVVFVAILLLPARRTAPAARPGTGGLAEVERRVQGSLLFGLPTIAFVLQYGLVRDVPFGPAFAALGFGAFYVALAAWLRRRTDLALTFDASLAVAVVFLTLVIPFALDARSTAGAWALEAAGLVWLGLRQRRRLPRAFGYALFLLAGASMMWAHETHGAPASFWNAYLWNGAMVTLAALAAAFFLHRDGGPPDGARSPAEASMQPLLIAYGTLWAIGTAAQQIDAFVDPSRAPAVALATGSVGVVLAVLAGVRLAWPGLRWLGVLLLPAALLVAVETLGRGAAPWEHGGLLAWPLAVAAHLVVLRHAARGWPDAVAHGVHAAGVGVLALVGAHAGSMATGRAVAEDTSVGWTAWNALGWAMVPALLLLLLPRPGFVARWPMRDQPDAYRVTAAAGLAVVMWLWTLLANLGSAGHAPPLPYVPLLNPLDLGVGLVLAAIALALHPRFAAALGARLGAGRSPRVFAALAFAGFVWLNAMLLRTFHHHGGVAWRPDAWLSSFPVHTGLALLWTATALVAMWWGARHGRRAPWVAGAVLLGLVVVKLILVDLMAAGTVARIVSFIGVGLLMLVIGYVAPLPAARVDGDPPPDADAKPAAAPVPSP